MKQCPHCNKPIIDCPISKEPFWIGEGKDKYFNWQAFKKENIIWKNVLKINFGNLFIVAMLIFLSWSYHHDIESCFNDLQPIKDDVCSFCSRFNTACMQKEAFNISNKDIYSGNWSGIE